MENFTTLKTAGKGTISVDHKGNVYPMPARRYTKDGKIMFISYPKFAPVNRINRKGTNVKIGKGLTIRLEYNHAIRQSFPIIEFGEFEHFVLWGKEMTSNTIGYVSKEVYHKYIAGSLTGISKIPLGRDGLPKDHDDLTEDQFNFFLDIQEWRMTIKTEMYQLANKRREEFIQNEADAREQALKDMQEAQEGAPRENYFYDDISSRDRGMIKDAFYDEKVSPDQIAAIFYVDKDVVMDVLMEDEERATLEFQRRSRMK